MNNLYTDGSIWQEMENVRHTFERSWRKAQVDTGKCRKSFCGTGFYRNVSCADIGGLQRI
jgi:hypothetical protein